MPPIADFSMPTFAILGSGGWGTAMAVLLVVAADEGVMPQTREHLDILELLGVRRGVVALSKSDLLPAELLELAREELVSTLASSALRGSEIIACSARTGEGLPELCRAIERALRQSPGRSDAGLTRLPVDRVFSLKGFGTVATGTLWSGRLRIGDELWPQPGQKNQVPAKVRGLHVHGQPVGEAVAGQRTAVNLPVPLAALQRGETLVRPDEIAAEQVGVLLDVELRYLEVARAPLGRRSRLLLSAGTAQRLAQVTLLDRERALPGETVLAQIQLDQPLCALPGDRFVLRGFAPQKNHGTTVGGGRILRVLGGRHRRGSPRLIAALGRVARALDALHPPDSPDSPDSQVAAPTALAELVRAEAERRGLGGVTVPGLRIAVPVPAAQLEAALQALLRERELVSVPPALYAPSVLRHIEEAVLAALAQHRRELAVGALRPALGRLGGDRTGVGEGPAILCPPRLASAALERLLERGLVRIDRELVLLPEPAAVGAAASPQVLGPVVAVDRDQALREGVLAVFREAGLAPPRLDELPTLLQASMKAAPAATALRGIVDGLCRTGALVRIKDLLFYKPHVDELRARLLQFLTAHREINPTQFKDLVGQSRKYTIPLAEHFDAEKVTLRVGDLRRLRTPAR